ncbi:MAG TPA: MBL fold metallo-hydrolase [Firmicutes bacterium]|nr:MBL fold metallo-hydrolase [Bacillota bacterium]
MIAEVQPGIFKIEVPLPQSPLKALNSYVVTGRRPLLIDTGYDHDACREVLFSSLEELGVKIAQLDVLMTHMHPDHSGLVSELVRLGARPYASREDADILNMRRGSEDFFRTYLQKCGFPAGTAVGAMLGQPGFVRNREAVPFRLLAHGDLLPVGPYRLRCLITPGHTPGHLCLYDEEKQILFAGDHILRDITPNISLWTEGSNPLADFLAELQKLCSLPVSLVLPGHRSLFSDCRGRIKELIHNHERRAAEVLQVMTGGEWLTVLDVAKQMSWRLSYASFTDFPLPQQLFAAGEALAHIRYLESLGRVAGTEQGGVYRFRVQSGN